MPDVIDELGYSPLQGDGLTMIHSAIGQEPGYLLHVSRFQALGFSRTDFRIHVHDLGEGVGVDGLLGLTFLRQLNLEIRPAEGRLLAHRIDAE